MDHKTGLNSGWAGRIYSLQQNAILDGQTKSAGLEIDFIGKLMQSTNN